MQIKPKNMLFSYNKNANFPDSSVGNNTINETSVAKFFLHTSRQKIKICKSYCHDFKLASDLKVEMEN